MRTYQFWGFNMATWKRLTNVENQKVDVNMDNVAYVDNRWRGVDTLCRRQN